MYPPRALTSWQDWPVTLNWFEHAEDYRVSGQRHQRGFETASEALDYAIWLGLSEFRID